MGGRKKQHISCLHRSLDFTEKRFKVESDERFKTDLMTFCEQRGSILLDDQVWHSAGQALGSVRNLALFWHPMD